MNVEHLSTQGGMKKLMHKHDVGGRLRLTREALGLSQQEMADKYGFGDKSVISNWERGKHYPDPWIVWQLHDQDGISADWIYLGRKGNLPAWVVEKVKVALARKPDAEAENSLPGGAAFEEG